MYAPRRVRIYVLGVLRKPIRIRMFDECILIIFAVVDALWLPRLVRYVGIRDEMIDEAAISGPVFALLLVDTNETFLRLL